MFHSVTSVCSALHIARLLWFLNWIFTPFFFFSLFSPFNSALLTFCHVADCSISYSWTVKKSKRKASKKNFSRKSDVTRECRLRWQPTETFDVFISSLSSIRPESCWLHSLHIPADNASRLNISLILVWNSMLLFFAAPMSLPCARPDSSLSWTNFHIFFRRWEKSCRELSHGMIFHKHEIMLRASSQHSESKQFYK